MICCNWSSRDGSAFSRVGCAARGLGPATVAFLRGVPGCGGVVTATLAAAFPGRAAVARLRGDAADFGGSGGSGGDGGAGGLRAMTYVSGWAARIAVADALCSGAVRNTQAGGVMSANAGPRLAGIRAARKRCAACPASARRV